MRALLRPALQGELRVYWKLPARKKTSWMKSLAGMDNPKFSYLLFLLLLSPKSISFFFSFFFKKKRDRAGLRCVIAKGEGNLAVFSVVVSYQFSTSPVASGMPSYSNSGPVPMVFLTLIVLGPQDVSVKRANRGHILWTSNQSQSTLVINEVPLSHTIFAIPETFPLDI